MRVYRYLLDVDDQVDIHMPEGARLLSVKAVGIRQIEMWALVEENGPAVRRRLRIAGTGHPIPFRDTAVYVGSTVSHDSPARLVWHVFDLGEIVG